MIYLSCEKYLHLKKLLLLSIDMIQKERNNIILKMTIQKDFNNRYFINNICNLNAEIKLLENFIKKINICLLGNKIDNKIIIEIKNMIENINFISYF